MAKFKLLAGQYHVLGDAIEDKDGVVTCRPTKTYKAPLKEEDPPTIIESDMDLLKFNGPGPKMKKFEKVEDPTELISAQAEIESLKAELAEARGEPVEPSPEGVEDPDDGLSTMTVSELRAYARDEEIDLGTATRKDEIINTIHSVMAEA